MSSQPSSVPTDTADATMSVNAKMRSSFIFELELIVDPEDEWME